jgi:hypothetical protein
MHTWSRSVATDGSVHEIQEVPAWCATDSEMRRSFHQFVFGPFTITVQYSNTVNLTAVKGVTTNNGLRILIGPKYYIYQ